MGRKLVVCFAAIALTLALGVGQLGASFEHFRLLRRQSGEGEQESTAARQDQQPGQQQKPAAPDGGRLYPDLGPRPNFLPPFANGGAPSPFVPYGVHLPNRLDADQAAGPFGRLPPQPRPMNPLERLQSLSFTSGLGKRLLSMIGVDAMAETNSTSEGSANAPLQRSDEQPAAMRLLQNSTLLQDLNKRVHQVLGGLGRMYNSTVQAQLSMLDERLRRETENSTNPWHQRVAQQVPMFFKQMTGRVMEAQQRLDRVWRDVMQVAQGNGSVPSGGPTQGQASQGRFFGGAFDQFLNFNGDGSPSNFFGSGQSGGDFVNQLSRSLGMGSPDEVSNQSQNASSSPDLAGRLREFWHYQVQPQVGQLRQLMARVWRDLTASGALTPDAIMRTRSSGSSGAQNASSNSGELADRILKELDTDSSEYSLVQPTSSDGSKPAQAGGRGEQSGPTVKLSPQMQNRLMDMQRELNQLWVGLSNSLQSAVRNVRNTLNPRAQFSATNTQQQRQQQEADPAQNEIESKIKDLTKLHREADVVHEAIKQQQLRETQQRQAASLGERLRALGGNVDANGLGQLPDRIGQQFNRFGTAVGNFWNTIPERWDNFMTSARQQDMQTRTRAQVTAAQSSPTTQATTVSQP